MDDKPIISVTSGNTGRNRGWDNLILIKPGERLNPNGRPRGQKNYSTLYREALIRLAKLNNKTPDELEVEILSKGLLNARAGDYRFYKDMLDRLHGTATQKSDITTNGQAITNDNQAAANAAIANFLGNQKPNGTTTDTAK